jgi:hypothetical protein
MKKKLNLHEQIAIGTKIEMEHTKSKKVARNTATDHIMKEGINYYPELIKMKKKLKGGKK